GPDIITDFQVGTDKIDLSSIDADPTIQGDQALGFSNIVGNVDRYGWMTYDHKNFGTEDTTVIEGNVTGDWGVDFRIVFQGVVNLTAADFIL
ncbi:MAG: M10 family metallopeptidase C-terminal domain-containing protein, partial [Hyphomicrobium sp.]